MKRTLIAIVASLALAGSASAVGLSLSTDASTYEVSDTITVTLTGDTTGAAAGTAVFAQVSYDGSLVSDGAATQDLIVSTFGFVSWVASNPACLASACTVFNQITLSALVPETNPVIGTLTLHASAIGTLTLGVIPGTLDFFGVGAPGDVTVTIVPEPTTAGLLGLGLLGLAAVGRRRN